MGSQAVSRTLRSQQMAVRSLRPSEGFQPISERAARVSADGRMPAAAYGGGAARLWYLPGRDAYGTAQLPITPLRPGTEPTESPPQ